MGDEQEGKGLGSGFVYCPIFNNSLIVIWLWLNEWKGLDINVFMQAPLYNSPNLPTSNRRHAVFKCKLLMRGRGAHHLDYFSYQSSKMMGGTRGMISLYFRSWAVADKRELKYSLFIPRRERSFLPFELA